LLQQQMYSSFNHVVWLWSNATKVGDIGLVDGVDKAHNAAGLQASTVTFFAIGAALPALPMLVGSVATLDIAVCVVAAMTGAIAAVAWLVKGGDQFIRDGEGTLEHRRGAHPSDPCMYALGLVGLGAACCGIAARQVVEIGYFCIGAGTGGLAAYLLQQHLLASLHLFPTDGLLQGRAPVAIAAAALGVVCAAVGPSLVIEVLSVLGAYLVAGSVLAMTGVEDRRQLCFVLLFTALLLTAHRHAVKRYLVSRTGRLRRYARLRRSSNLSV
jgi:hypothetical protein